MWFAAGCEKTGTNWLEGHATCPFESSYTTCLAVVLREDSPFKNTHTFYLYTLSRAPRRNKTRKIETTSTDCLAGDAFHYSGACLLISTPLFQWLIHFPRLSRALSYLSLGPLSPSHPFLPVLRLLLLFPLVHNTCLMPFAT